MRITRGELVMTRQRRCGTAVPLWRGPGYEPDFGGVVHSVFDSVGILLDRKKLNGCDMVHVLWANGMIGWSNSQYVRRVASEHRYARVR